MAKISKKKTDQNEEDIDIPFSPGDDDGAKYLNPDPDLVNRVNQVWEKRRPPVVYSLEDMANKVDFTIPDPEKLSQLKIVNQEQMMIQSVNQRLDEMYRNLRREMDHQLKLPFDKAKVAMNEVMKAMGYSGRNYRVEGTNIASILNNMIRWSVYDPECEWDVNKGIYFWGPVGCGKTTLAKFLEAFTHAIGFRNSDLVHVKSIMIDVSDAKHLGPLKKYLMGKWIFNDIGFEDDDKLFANKVDLVERVFPIRADDGRLTHATGNVPMRKEGGYNELKSVYGTRIASRFPEMFNSVEVISPWDFRKEEWKAGFIH